MCDTDKSTSSQQFVDMEIISDVQINCRGSSQKAFRALLASVFPAYEEAFVNGTEEALLEELSSFSMEAIEQVIQFSINGEIQISTSTVLEFLSLSKILKKECWTEECIQFIAGRISPENISNIWNFAKEKGLLDLETACLSIAKTHPAELASSVSGQAFLASLDLVDFLGVLSSPSLRAPDEETLFRLVASWLSDKPDDVIRESASRLFGHLNPLRLLHWRPFIDVEMAHHPLTRRSVFFRDLIREARMLIQMPGLAVSGQITTFNTTSQRLFSPPRDAKLVSFSNDYSTVTGICIIDLASAQITADIKTDEVFSPMSWVIENKVYVFGEVFRSLKEAENVEDDDNADGADDEDKLVERFPRYSHPRPPNVFMEDGLSDVGGLFASTSETGDSAADKIESSSSSSFPGGMEPRGLIIDLQTQTFRVLPKYRSKKSVWGAAGIRGKVVLICSEESAIIYDTTNDRFYDSKLPSNGLFSPCLLTINDRFILSIGGSDHTEDSNILGDVSCLEPPDDWLVENAHFNDDTEPPTWKAMPPLLQARIDFAAAFVYGKIFVVGGTNNNINQDSVEVFKSTGPTAFLCESDWLPQGQWTRVANLKFRAESYWQPKIASGNGLCILDAFCMEDGEARSRIWLAGNMDDLKSWDWKQYVLEPSSDPLRLTLGKSFPDFREHTWRWEPLEGFSSNHESRGIAFCNC